MNNDLISRQSALDCFHDWIDSRGNVHTADEIPEYNAIMELPPVQPDRKTGHWKHINEEEERAKHNGQLLGWMPWYCSECGCGVGKHQTQFCPNCGADMRGKHDGN